MSLTPSASQTVGPYFAIGLSWLDAKSAIGARPTSRPGDVLQIGGRVLDGRGEPVVDAVLEIWRPGDDAGVARDAEPLNAALAQGFGRVPTQADGGFRFSVLRPLAMPGQAPHLVVLVHMRGLLKPASTRLYLDGAAENAVDPVLGMVPAERRSTLIATAARDGSLRWDVHMQGGAETVFFDY